MESVRVGGAVAVPWGRARTAREKPKESANADQSTIVNACVLTAKETSVDVRTRSRTRSYMAVTTPVILNVHQLMTSLRTWRRPLARCSCWNGRRGGLLTSGDRTALELRAWSGICAPSDVGKPRDILPRGANV